MKHYLASLLALCSPVLQASPDEYVNFVRQIQQDSGIEWDMGIRSSGVKISPTGVSRAGSFFELWAIHDQSITEYRLDEQYVTAYTPNATVRILTGDPYKAVPRTRVDLSLIHI